VVFRAGDSQGRDTVSGSSRAGNSKVNEVWRLRCGCVREMVSEVKEEGGRVKVVVRVWAQQVCSMLRGVDL